MRVKDPTREAPQKAPKGSADLMAAKKQYEDDLKAVQTKLKALCQAGQRATWDFAVLAQSESERLTDAYGDIATKERVYQDLSIGSEEAPNTFKKRVVVVEWLQSSSLEEVYARPVSGFSKMKAIVCEAGGLDDDQKKELAVEVYKHDKAHPEAPFTVQDVKAMIKDRTPVSEKDEEWKRPTDYWAFSDYDERMGHEGYPGRLPGQAVMNILWRWLPPGGNFLAAMCGSGTALDAAKFMKITKEYRGFDLVLSERLQKRHGDRVVTFDGTKSDWRKSVPDGWKADLVLLTPPYFSFVAHSMTQDATDMGNLVKPDEYLESWNAVAAGVTSVLEPGGILAVVTRNSAEFDNPTPIPDFEHEIVNILYGSGAADSFLARPVVRLGKFKVKDPNNEGKPWLIPEVLTIHVFRRLAK